MQLDSPFFTSYLAIHVSAAKAKKLAPIILKLEKKSYQVKVSAVLIGKETSARSLWKEQSQTEQSWSLDKGKASTPGVSPLESRAPCTSSN